MREGFSSKYAFRARLSHFSVSLTSPSGRKYITHVVKLGDSSVGAGIRRVPEKGNTYLSHTPLHSGERFRGKSADGKYGDAVEEIDWSTGEILAVLEKLGLDERTFVVFTSDNAGFMIWTPIPPRLRI